MNNQSNVSAQIVSVPQGGGALSGIGEKFSPDLFTGTGNFSVPISLPPGRSGFQPELSLVYSTGNGNGPFGLGWSLSVPGVSRKTSKGVPRYDDAEDTFILSGAEDLVPVETRETVTRYRPRTEGLFARILHHRDADNDYWEVRSKDGLRSFYGTPEAAEADPAVVANPADRTRVFAWKLTRTLDPFGNRIEYTYERDAGEDGPHHWDQLYLSQIRYVDYDDDQGEEQFLVSVTFDYGTPDAGRPDQFSDYRSGFEVRTRGRCERIVVRTHAGEEQVVRTYELIYLDERVAEGELPEAVVPHNGVSLLSQIRVVGHDGEQTEALPPLEFGYTRFEPERRDLFPLEGADLPARSLASPDLELADLFGNGLPDVLQMNGTVRYWRNLGGGRFDIPRSMHDAPAGLALADPGVQLIDADGDGRIDLLATANGLSGYFPLNFDGTWDRRFFRRYEFAPSFNPQDPEVQLVDLDGDGVTDAVRSGSRLEYFFNDPDEGWNGTRRVGRRALQEFPNVNFSDPRVRWADMTGDGLQDILLVYDGNVEYWPSLGYGDWGRRVHMRNSPRFPYGYDPRRILIGDVDGDGLADLVYVDHCKVLLWINQSGNGWSEPIEIDGTPPVTDVDAVRLVDVRGTGVSGVLWSADARAPGRDHHFFLDFTGGFKPYLLAEMDNHMGAVTRVEYAPSTRFYLADQQDPDTRWQTPLPFPVQVVARVEVIDEISRGKLTTEYRYHHGYWDGAEREFRGFGMVEQLDTETFERYNAPGLHGEAADFDGVDEVHFAPPTLTKTWFHHGPIGEEHGDWYEADYSGEYWPGDPSLLERPASLTEILEHLPRRVKRDALRALRGSVLRAELYALDESGRDDRPYTVTESQYGLCGVLDDENAQQLLCEASDLPTEWMSEAAARRVFFPHLVAQRTTQWERGDDPMTSFSFTGDYDEYGLPRTQTALAVARGRDFRIAAAPGEPYLGTHTVTRYAHRDDEDHYLIGRVVQTTTHEILNDGSPTLFDLLENALEGETALRIVGQTLNYYDGDAFTGLPPGQLGDFGALVRSESLVLTEEILHDAYRSGEAVLDPPEMPPYLDPDGPPVWTDDYPQEFRDRLPALAGYTFHAGDGDHARGYFAETTRHRYDFHDDPATARGLPLVMRDPLGRDTAITYDDFALLPVTVTGPTELTTEAHYDYRVMQPDQVTDPNGNRQAFEFTPLGLLESIAVMGKEGEEVGEEGEEVGDTPEVPGTRFSYDFLAFMNSPPENRQPVSVRTIVREHHVHDTDVPLPERDATIETVEYSDGFGRLLQTRTQAEEVFFGDAAFAGNAGLPLDQAQAGGPAFGQQIGPDAPPRVVVSGWQTYDNKGRVVEKYEPFFSFAGFEFAPPSEVQRGRRVTMFYDPRGQVIRTVNPDGSEQRVIYGVPDDLTDPDTFTPTPWEVYTYDANDLAPLSAPPGEPGATLADQAPEEHHFTPASTEIDALGRTIRAVERNGPDPDTDWFVTRSTYDIQGNLLTVTDALGRVAFRYVYDLAGNALRTDSIDAGLRRTVLDVLGSPVEQRDSKGALLLSAYDNLNRPIRLWARDDPGQLLTLREHLIYGDGEDAGLPDAEARARNLLGQLAAHYDEAGRLIAEAYDFKGNLLEKTRQVIRDDAILSVFAAPPPGFQIEAFRVDWQPAAGATLDDRAGELLALFEYTSTAAYDALNRAKRVHYPEDVEGERRELVPSYNRAGALESVALDGETYVDHIAYNAKGQRTLIAYGNGVMTRYAYDQQTFRLRRLRSERYTQPADHAYQPTAPNQPLQDFAYTYDLVGNILNITDRTPGCGVQDNPEAALIEDPALAILVVSGNALVRRFEYDPLYRLMSATGRECRDIPRPRPWTDAPRCGFNSGNHGTPNQDNAPNLTTTYRERYTYDPAGNMTAMRHQVNGDAWTRHFGMGGLTPDAWSQEWPNHLVGQWADPPSNRLTHVGDDAPTTLQTHFYDASGNVTRETISRHFEWDHSDRMRVFRNQVEGAEPSIHAHYLYDAAGQRVMKLVRRQGGRVDVTVYIDGLFEHHRRLQTGNVQENNTLHAMDDQQRIALVRVGSPFSEDTTPAIKFHLGDHLGSSHVVVSMDGVFVNREEYTPYGETSFGSFLRKCYRSSEKCRDEESGLYYHGARYYAPWLGRWFSADPSGIADGLNVYSYVRDNPINSVDELGLDTEKLSDKSVQELTEMLDNVEREIIEVQEANEKFVEEMDKIDAGVKRGGRAENVLKASNRLAHEASKFPETLEQTQDIIEILEERLQSEGTYNSPRGRPTGRTLRIEKALDKARRAGKQGYETLTRTKTLIEKGAKTIGMISPSLSRFLKQIGNTLSKSTLLLKSLETVGKVAGPITIGIGVNQARTAEDTDELIDAGLTIIGGVLETIPNPYTRSLGVGISAGQIVDSTLDVSDYSSSFGDVVRQKAESLGLGEDASSFIGGAATVAATGPSILYAGVAKIME